MNEALVVFLVLLWALVLLPGAIRARRTSPRNTVGGFEHAMDVLRNRPAGGSRSSGRYVMVPRDAGAIIGGTGRRDAVVARRRKAFTMIVGVVGTTFLLSLVGSGRWWLLFLLSVGALGSYVSLLLRWKSQRLEAARVVRTLPSVAAEAPAEELVRVAGGDDAYGLPVATRPDQPWEPQSSVRIRRWEA